MPTAPPLLALASTYGHLQDLIATSYTTAYMGPWCDQLGAVLPAQDFSTAASAVTLSGTA